MTAQPEDRIAAHIDRAELLELDVEQPRILAFGSQLVHGSVGLNAAERVYQLADLRVARVPSIVLSVMPHYASFHHIDVDAGWITHTLDDLGSIGALDSIAVVTSGYLANPAQAEAIAAWFESLPVEAQPVFVLDPTLGDVEVGFITHPGLVQAHAERLAPLATGLTPNLFELAHLTGTTLEALGSPEAVIDVAETLLGEHTRWIAVTGVAFDDDIGVLLIERAANADSSITEVRHERVDTSAKGLGDTFAAGLGSALVAGAPIEDAVVSGITEVLTRIT